MDINRISFGTIICWKDIPHFNGLKDRLFICLGKDTTGALLLTTTTSNVDLYKSDVVRKAYRVFLSAETTPCSEDCMVDYNRASYPVLSEANDAKVIQAISEDKIVVLCQEHFPEMSEMVSRNRHGNFPALVDLTGWLRLSHERVPHSVAFSFE